mmetsp:Transcript_92651/g.265551  ORF Transcript_92651/g.265551 Transcript_92651/m.265551 type:complete len:267 (-) Transcript_92651:979-1779(-)
MLALHRGQQEHGEGHIRGVLLLELVLALEQLEQHEVTPLGMRDAHRAVGMEGRRELAAAHLVGAPPHHRRQQAQEALIPVAELGAADEQASDVDDVQVVDARRNDFDGLSHHGTPEHFDLPHRADQHSQGFWRHLWNAIRSVSQQLSVQGDVVDTQARASVEQRCQVLSRKLALQCRNLAWRPAHERVEVCLRLREGVQQGRQTATVRDINALAHGELHRALESMPVVFFALPFILKPEGFRRFPHSRACHVEEDESQPLVMHAQH